MTAPTSPVLRHRPVTEAADALNLLAEWLTHVQNEGDASDAFEALLRLNGDTVADIARRLAQPAAQQSEAGEYRQRLHDFNAMTDDEMRPQQSEAGTTDLLASLIGADQARIAREQPSAQQSSSPSPLPVDGLETVAYRVTWVNDSSNDNDRRMYVDGQQWAKIYGWNHASLNARCDIIQAALENRRQSAADALEAANRRAERAEAEAADLRKAVEFYANEWTVPAIGPRDAPEPTIRLSRDHGQRARQALAAHAKQEPGA
jgi:hypothetical protein